MTKAVAVEGDTQVVTSTAKHPGDVGQSGSWTESALQVTVGETISVAGKKVELSAQMIWIYAGGTVANGSPMPPVTDTATLTAGSTKLKDMNHDLLVDGDEVAGTVDSSNKILVTTSQGVLKTA